MKKERERGPGEESERVKEMARRAKVQNKMVCVCLSLSLSLSVFDIISITKRDGRKSVVSSTLSTWASSDLYALPDIARFTSKLEAASRESCSTTPQLARSVNSYVFWKPSSLSARSRTCSQRSNAPSQALLAGNLHSEERLQTQELPKYSYSCIRFQLCRRAFQTMSLHSTDSCLCPFSDALDF